MERRMPYPGMTQIEKLELIHECLTGSYTQVGIEKWFHRRRTKLGGLTPAQAIEQGRTEEVLNLAISLRDGAMGT